MTSKNRPYYKQLNYWLKNYGNSGASDQQAVQTFVDCENREVISGFRAELLGITHGNYADELFDRSVGVKRRARHGSYSEWAKMMLLWLASYKG
jgi:hypothetical protein